jgi:hypothetical protein
VISNVRFRTEGDLVVLQIAEGFGSGTIWFDAKVTDLLEVSAYFNTQMGTRLEMVENNLNALTDKVWDEA